MLAEPGNVAAVLHNAIRLVFEVDCSSGLLPRRCEGGVEIVQPGRAGPGSASEVGKRGGRLPLRAEPATCLVVLLALPIWRGGWVEVEEVRGLLLRVV